MPTTDINLNLSYVESVTGTAVDNTDPQNPVIDLGDGITAIAAVGDILRVKTIGAGGVVIDLEPTNNTSSQYTENTTIVSEFGQIDRTVEGVNGTTATQITENKFTIYNTPTVGGGAVFIIENGDYYFQSVSIPIASTGFLTVAADGKIGVGAGGGTTTNPLTIGTGLSGTSFDGSAAVTIEIDSTVATLTGNQVLTNKTLTSPVIGAIVGLNGQIAHTTTAQASGAIIDYLFTPSNHTGQTASTNSPVFRIAASTKTFATGAITNAYGTHIESTTLAFAGASVVTNSYGLYVEGNTAGTNATLTNTYGIGCTGFLRVAATSTTQGTIIRNDTTANYAAIYNGNVTPSNINFALKYNGATAWMNATTGGSIILSYTAASVLSISSGTAINIAEGVSMNAGTTTGLKIGGATTHKLALWNKTPIVQPTTAITGATLVSNAGTTITSTDTFGGYTLQQIAAALVNFGLLA